MIPYGRQSIDEDDIAAVVDVLRSDWLTQGPAIDAFEADLIAATGAQYAVAFSNGTAALHGAMAAAGVGAGDRVATTPLSFAASANCARYVGADITFVDIDPDTWNLRTADIPVGLDALVAVHFAGLPIAMAQLANRPRVIIEDAAHAIGALTPDGPVGNCAHSDMCCFSFHPVKTITTGEGGAVTTNDPQLAERLRRFRSHGMVRSSDKPAWWYDIPEPGYNYRLTDLQAALGSSQMRKLDRFVTRRNQLADQYRELCRDLPIGLPPAAPVGSTHAYHLFAVRVADRDRVYTELRDAGIGTQVHYRPIYEHGAFQQPATDYPACAAIASELLSLPLYPDLTDDDQAFVVDTLRKVL
ncbi:MAG: UDP-4-amino-4,6-dideoxy-N-acetyl-beta-L-altrosamine transaminase [Acidimicrobiia bacterium]